MDATMTAAEIHYYDTAERRILCGLRGFDHRSTKHARGVTCRTCVGLLDRQLHGEAAGAATEAS